MFHLLKVKIELSTVEKNVSFIDALISKQMGIWLDNRVIWKFIDSGMFGVFCMQSVVVYCPLLSNTLLLILFSKSLQ